MKISVVVPAYNEAGRILPTLEQILAYMDEHHPDYEVVVVDDGSSDGTAAVVSQRFQGKPQLRVLSYGGNRGKGYAVRHGALHSSGDVVLFTDADLSTPIAEIEKVLPRFEQGYDLVIASRAHAQAEIRARQPFYREGVGKLFNLLVRLLVLPAFHDTQCGFKAFRREPMQSVLKQQQVDGFAFDVEMIALALAKGLKVIEVPVVWENSPSSSVKLSRGIAAFFELIPIRRRARQAANLARHSVEARP